MRVPVLLLTVMPTLMGQAAVGRERRSMQRQGRRAVLPRAVPQRSVLAPVRAAEQRQAHLQALGPPVEVLQMVVACRSAVE